MRAEIGGEKKDSGCRWELGGEGVSYWLGNRGCWCGCCGDEIGDEDVVVLKKGTVGVY